MPFESLPVAVLIFFFSFHFVPRPLLVIPITSIESAPLIVATTPPPKFYLTLTLLLELLRSLRSVLIGLVRVQLISDLTPSLSSPELPSKFEAGVPINPDLPTINCL